MRANADTPEDAAKARELARRARSRRTEHMFMAPDRLPGRQEMILAADEKAARRAVLDRLLPVQQADFEAIFEAMAASLTIRLLDPPLHEFLLPVEEATSDAMRRRIEQLREANPDVRDARLPVKLQHPEIAEMQVRAIVSAARAVGDWTGEALLEIMHLLVGFAEELRHARGS